MAKIKKYRPGVYIVTYKINKKIKYLLLHRILHWTGWEFPKGGIKKSEIDKNNVVKRELKEETGLKVAKIDTFNKKGRFNYGRELPDRPGVVGQKWKLYSAEVKGRVNLSQNKDKEHDNYKWLNFKKAYNLLTWPSQKKCLKIVDAWLKSKK